MIELQAERLVQRSERHQRDDGRAVRVRDDVARMVFRGFRIDFRHDQRHVRIHPEGGRIVDHHRAGGSGGGAEFLGNPAARAEERDVHVVKRIMREFLDDDFLAAEFHLFPGGTRRSQKLQLAERKIPLFKAKEHFHADGTRRANNRHMGLIHGLKKPAF